MPILWGASGEAGESVGGVRGLSVGAGEGQTTHGVSAQSVGAAAGAETGDAMTERNRMQQEAARVELMARVIAIVVLGLAGYAVVTGIAGVLR